MYSSMAEYHEFFMEGSVKSVLFPLSPYSFLLSTFAVIGK